MFNVKVPATSANLGSGFDVLGLALNIFNEYSFEEKEEFSLKGFAPRYLDLNKNLVLSSYKKAFEYLGKEPIAVEICETERNIPRAGGLGSSSACVVAGLLGANYVLKGILSSHDLLAIATQIEGHPDNVAPCLFGGLTACYRTDNGVKAEKYHVADTLKFLVCYPDFYVSTELAREALPKQIDVKKAVENLSRVANLPRAFERGDMELICHCVKDNIHEPYRIKLIDEGELMRKTAHDLGVACVISGSGATMLVISDKSVKAEFEKLNTKHDWTYLEVKPYLGE